jgi:hypothetical protein
LAHSPQQLAENISNVFITVETRPLKALALRELFFRAC